MAERYEKFSERSRRVLSFSQEEALRFNHNYIGTEHLLLGLLREPEGVAARTLVNLGAKLDKMRAAIELIVGRGSNEIDSSAEIGLTPRVKRVIELSIDEARRMSHHYIGTEHLLIGIIREGEGVGAGVIGSLGIKLEDVREETLRLLSASTKPFTVDSNAQLTNDEMWELIDFIGKEYVKTLPEGHALRSIYFKLVAYVTGNA